LSRIDHKYIYKKGRGNLLGFNKKFLGIIAPLLVFMYLGIFANQVLAYTPQSLYDEVWKLVYSKYVDANENGQSWQRWRHKYDSVINSDNDAYVAIETMLASLNDPYTRFLNPEEFADEGSSIKGTLYGIGVQIGVREDKLLVIAPIEDTPAAKAGLQANDEIIQIDGKSTKGISVKEAADKIRGQQGTTVKLLVKRGKEEKLYTITRDKISVKSVTTKEPKTANLENNIGYIRLNSFISSSASVELSAALKTEKNKEGYILDIRSNPGGLLTNAITISDMFLDDGVIVSTVDRDGYKETQKASRGVLTDKPLVILIDEGSASASEILSGALQDNGRATIVGTKSFGKGLVQEINKLPGGSGINITTQKYLTPNGTDINKVGIHPDIEVKITPEDIKKNHDEQLEKAQEVLKDLIAKSKSKEPKVINVNNPLKIIVR
jgi:carboxyl-terminal processing protease